MLIMSCSDNIKVKLCWHFSAVFQGSTWLYPFKTLCLIGPMS